MMYDPDFMPDLAGITWADLLWACQNGVIGWRVPVSVALSRARAPYTDTVVTDLLVLDPATRAGVHDVLAAAAAQKPVPPEVSRRKWVFLELWHLYRNRDAVDDMFDKLYDIFAAFDYPASIYGFAPLMPPEDAFDPLAHTPGEGRASRIRKWGAYLRREAKALAKLRDKAS